MRRRNLLYGLGLAPLRLPAQTPASAPGSAPASGELLRVAATQHDVEAWIALQVLAAVYLRAGLRFVPVMLPPVRASMSIGLGDADAELMRPIWYQSDHPDLVFVPTPFYRIFFHAYWLPGRSISVNSTPDLRPYSVGIVRGLSTARAVADSVAGLKPIYAINHEQLCAMLHAGHVQVALDTQQRMLQALHAQGMDNALSSPELARFDLYHYVSARFAADAPRIDAAIRAIGPAELEHMALQLADAARKLKPGEF